MTYSRRNFNISRFIYMHLTTTVPKINLNDNPFRLGSSKVDWCEPNYVLSEYIAEFWNTVRIDNFIIHSHAIKSGFNNI
jgi:hypothetical protein